MKKVVVFGGGTGLSCLLSGLKLFPVDVTTVITVSDNGSSTGVLKKELDIPAVGDVGKVLISMANVDEDFTRLLRYRFSKDGSLHNHPVRNVMLAALIDLKGNLTEATRYMCRLLNVKGTVLPLTEERVELVGETDKGRKAFYGQVAVSRNIRSISRLSYDHDVHVTQEVVSHIRESDLIIFSPGSLYTSILPHLIAPAVVEAIAASSAPILYVCNLVTQPGETDGNGPLPADVLDVYHSTEDKSAVMLDREAVEALGASIIEDAVAVTEDGQLRHDALRTAFLIFSYLMRT